MPIVEEVVEISTDRETVFDISQDYDTRHEWDPFSKNTYLLHGAKKTCKGAEGYVHSKLNFKMWFHYVNFDRPTRAAIVMRKGPFFFEKFGGSWIFEDINTHGATRARFRYSFTTKYKLLRPVLDWIIQLVFRKQTRSRLRALKQYCEKR